MKSTFSAQDQSKMSKINTDNLNSCSLLFIKYSLVWPNYPPQTENLGQTIRGQTVRFQIALAKLSVAKLSYIRS